MTPSGGAAGGPTETVMRDLMQLLATQHGVASTVQVRSLGISRRVERRLLSDGILYTPQPGVVATGGAPPTFHGLAMAAALAPGVTAISHGAAARLHRLRGFEHHDTIDVIATRGASPRLVTSHTCIHWTRRDLGEAVTHVGPIPVLSIPATLALLGRDHPLPVVAVALDDALRRGIPAEAFQRAADDWRCGGRSGPAVLRRLLAERADPTLPRQWFDRLAHVLDEIKELRLRPDVRVTDRLGRVVAILPLADPARRIGIDCPTWVAGDTVELGRVQRRRREVLRGLGWSVIDVTWRELQRPDLIVGELLALTASSGGGQPAASARSRATAS